MLSTLRIFPCYLKGAQMPPCRAFTFKTSRDTSALLQRIERHAAAGNIAVVNSCGSAVSYSELISRANRLTRRVLLSSSHENIMGGTIAGLCSNSSEYIVAMLTSWLLNCRFLPLCSSHSKDEIQYVLTDSGAALALGNVDDTKKLPENLQYVSTEEGFSDADNRAMKFIDFLIYNNKSDSCDALVVYTSGTTGRPKGVVHTHESLEQNIKGLVSVWEYQPTDYILHFLPLHHLHGILNKLLCILWAGGTVEFLKSPSSSEIWSRLGTAPDAVKRDPTLFMAVPTVYSRLLEYSTSHGADQSQRVRSVLRAMRLHVSGSASLPDTVMNDWCEFSGHTLLERYGMTETGMVLGNSYRGYRKSGYVGREFPSVECRIVNEDGSVQTRISGSRHEAGELQIRGPTLFKEYINLPEVTRKAFSPDGWFISGDIVDQDDEGRYRVLGRRSMDIIKSNGFKLSALEIERVCLSHPWVREVAVVGVHDAISGEVVVAVYSLKKLSTILSELNGIKRKSIESSYWVQLTNQITSSSSPEKQEMMQVKFKENFRPYFLNDRLAPYKHPVITYFVDELPRNHLGKVNKKTLLSDCFNFL